MQQKYVRDAERRLQFFPHYVQSKCLRCGAWLTELPTAALPIDPEHWDFVWTCPRCQFDHHDRSSKPLEAFRPDPEADIVSPGTLPTWSEWHMPERVAFAALEVAEAYAEPVDPSTLEGRESVLDHDGVRRTAWAPSSATWVTRRRSVCGWHA